MLLLNSSFLLFFRLTISSSRLATDYSRSTTSRQQLQISYYQQKFSRKKENKGKENSKKSRLLNLATNKLSWFKKNELFLEV